MTLDSPPLLTLLSELDLVTDLSTTRHHLKHGPRSFTQHTFVAAPARCQAVLCAGAPTPGHIEGQCGNEHMETLGKSTVLGLRSEEMSVLWGAGEE